MDSKRVACIKSPNLIGSTPAALETADAKHGLVEKDLDFAPERDEHGGLSE